MGPDRFERWGAPPARLDYQSRLRPRRARGHPSAADDWFGQPVTCALRATAATVVVGCLSIAVPCLVFAVVGWWFNDVSTEDAAWVAVGAAMAAAVAAVPAIACHLRIVHHRATGEPAMWN